MRRYNGLVRDGQARPFTCPDCSNALQTARSDNDDVVLVCPYDNSAFRPGANWWGDVKAVVSEFYIES